MFAARKDGGVIPEGGEHRIGHIGRAVKIRGQAQVHHHNVQGQKAHIAVCGVAAHRQRAEQSQYEQYGQRTLSCMLRFSF